MVGERGVGGTGEAGGPVRGSRAGAGQASGWGGTEAAVLCRAAVRGETWNRMERDGVMVLMRALGGAC